MYDKIKIPQLMKEINSVVSEGTIRKAIQSGLVDGEKRGRDFWVNKESVIKYLNLNEYATGEYLAMSSLSEKYNVSTKSINDYCVKYGVRNFYMGKCRYINEKDFIEKLPIINANKYVQNKDGGKSEEMFTKFKSILGDEYEILGNYKNLKSKIDVLHKACGVVSPLTPDNTIYRGCKCPICYGTRKYTLEEAKAIIDELSNGNYELVSDSYDSNKADIYIRHTSDTCKGHNRPYKTRLNDFKSGYRCPYCNMSSGELSIFDFLSSNNFDFKYQEPIDYAGHRLSFDFKVNDYYIEFDGKQHFQEVNCFSTPLSEVVYRDRLKDQFIRENDFKLVRISYKHQSKINQILTDFLINKTFNDYPLGEYRQVLSENDISSESYNITYIG